MLFKYGIIEKPLIYTVRKGKEHYICDMRLDNHLKNITNRDSYIVPVLKKMRNYSWQDIDLGNISKINRYTKSMINVPESCSKDFCRTYGECRYCSLKSYFDSEDTDIQITNFNYYLADAIRKNENQPPILKDPCTVIFDEAHLLVDAARTMYGEYLNRKTINKISEYIMQLHIKDTNLNYELYDDSKLLKKLNDALFYKLSVKSDMNLKREDAERFPVSISDTVITHILNYMKKLLLKISDELDDSYLISERSIRKAKHIIHLSKITARKIGIFLSNPNLILWLEFSKVTRKTSGDISLFGIPKNIPDLLMGNIWASPEPKILTSGTLSIDGNFTHTKETNGIDKLQKSRVVECSYPSPFDYINNTIIYFSENVPFPDSRNKEYIQALSNEIERLILTTHGHALVLFTSYKVMDMTYGIIQNRISNIPIITAAKGNLLGIKEYKKSKNGVLFATGSCWEGIDIPGDILSSLIIIKLPFPSPDPILDYEKSLYKDTDSFKMHVLVPHMQIKLKQDCGRLIRNEKDTGVISILDSRCKPGTKYHNDVVKALYGENLTSDIQDVKDFIRKVKPDDYFC